MTEIIFYQLSNNYAGNRCLFACKLTEKAYRLGHKVFIRTESEQQGYFLDNQLWTFRQQSFIPHTLVSNPQQTGVVPVLLGATEAPLHFDDVLINLHSDLPQPVEQFQQVIELVNADEAVKRQLRQKYRQYTLKGYQPEIRKTRQ